MRKDIRVFAVELGLIFSMTFLKQVPFYIAVILAPITLAVGWIAFPNVFTQMSFTWAGVLLMVVWQPFIEELLFRGIIQGQLIQRIWFSVSWWGISRGNVIVSLLFTAVHFLYHPPLWALAVFLPSLVFGWFRDRYRQIYPGMFLHAFYNGCFLFLMFSL
jgi:membrane protease YdiL (CAAX protease family)